MKIRDKSHSKNLENEFGIVLSEASSCSVFSQIQFCLLHHFSKVFCFKNCRVLYRMICARFSNHAQMGNARIHSMILSAIVNTDGRVNVARNGTTAHLLPVAQMSLVLITMVDMCVRFLLSSTE